MKNQMTYQAQQQRQLQGEGAGGTPPAPPAPAPAGGTPAPQPAPPATGAAGATGTEEELRFDPKSFQARLDRHSKSVLKDLGFESPEAAKAAREKLAAMEKAEEERKLAEMTEIDRLKAQLAAKEAAEAAAKAALAAEQFTAKLERSCFAKGAKNTAFARFLVEQAKANAGGADIDVDAVLDAALKDESTKAALGIVTAPPVVTVPPTTTPQNPQGVAPQPPPAGNPSPAKSVKEMSPDEWRAWKQAHGMPA